MSRTDRKPYHHGELYRALLDAGDRLLHEFGLRGFTLRACARLAGVSHAAPRHHFGDVTGFLTAIAARGFKRLSVTLAEEIARAPSLADEFIATTRAYAGFAEQNPEHFRIMFRSDLLDTDSPRLRHYIGVTLTELTNVILRQRGEPEIRVEELNDKVKAETLLEDILIGWAHIHGLAHLGMEGQLRMVPAHLHDQLIDRASRRLSHLLQEDDRDRLPERDSSE